MTSEQIDHDKLYKELITNFFKEFMDGFFPEASSYIDYNHLEFLQQDTVVDIRQKEKKVIDILVKTKLRGEEGYVLVHVEPQAQKQGSFNERMFRYFCNLYLKHDMKILPVAVLAHDIKKEEPDSYSIEFPFHKVVDFNFLQLHLKRYYWREFLNKENPAVAALLCKMDYAREDRRQIKREFFRMILKLRLDPAKAEILTTFMDTYLKLPPEEEEAVIGELEEDLSDEEVKKLEELMTSWERKGREEGKAEGELNALKTVIINLAKQKFGSIEGSTEEKINNTNQKEKLEAVVSELINLESEKELIKILEKE